MAGSERYENESKIIKLRILSEGYSLAFGLRIDTNWRA